MSRALTTPAAQFLMLGLVLAAAGAGAPWFELTTTADSIGTTSAYSLLSYRQERCKYEGTPVVTTCETKATWYLSAGSIAPEFRSLAAAACVCWVGCALLAGAAIAALVASCSLHSAHCKSSSSSVARAVVAWFSCVLLFLGIVLGAANFAAVQKASGERPKVAAGPPLVGVGLLLTIVGSALLSAAACIGGRAAPPLNSSQQQHVVVVVPPSPHAEELQRAKMGALIASSSRKMRGLN